MRPLLGCTMGDPAGVGPDIVLRAIAEHDLPAGVLLLGDPELWRQRAAAHHPDLRLTRVRDASEARRLRDGGDAGPWGLGCCSVAPDLEPGRPRATDGRAALDCILAGADLAAAGGVDALVTAPVNKDLIALHAPRFRGHTELLAERAGVADPVMLFAGPRPHVALLTTHLPLATALTLVRRDAVEALLRRLAPLWQAAFGKAPVIGVAGLNPHAGERGRLGTEESRVLAPAIRAVRAEGIDARGPYPADSVFLHESVDVVLALYHDQGTIIAKRGPGPTVNLTLGLPYVRTSPDHGTAYDRAASGTADHAPMRAALELAAQLAAARVPPTG